MVRVMKIGGLPVRQGGSHEDIRFSDFIGRLRRYSRSSVAMIASHISWTIWFNNPPTSEPEDMYLCRAFMPNVAALGLAVFKDHRDRKTPSEVEMRKLAKDYLAIRSPISDPKLHLDELAALAQSLRSSEHFSGIDASEKSLRIIYCYISLARDLRAQWSPRATTLAALLRGWSMANALDARVPGFMGRFREQWNIELRDLLRCCMGLLALSGDDRGHLGASSLFRLGTEDVESFGISVEAMQLVANRLGQRPRRLEEWYLLSGRADAHGVRLAPWEARTSLGAGQGAKVLGSSPESACAGARAPAIVRPTPR